MRIDLHAHTDASDGHSTPEQLMWDAVAADVQVVAVTDHDTTAAWEAVGEAGMRHGVTVVPGIEVTAREADATVHVLGYLLDPRHPALAAALGTSREARVERARRMVAAMERDGLPVSWAAVTAELRPGATVGRPHLADALVRAGAVADRTEAFAGLLSQSSPYYEPTPRTPDPVEAVRIILAAGGVAVMAHPLAAERGPVVGLDVMERMIDAGLAGLEAHHRDHQPDDVRRLVQLAERRNILVTGASDYHGTGKPNRMGENSTLPEVYDALVRGREARLLGAPPSPRPA